MIIQRAALTLYSRIYLCIYVQKDTFTVYKYKVMKQSFGKILDAMMKEKGVNQLELAKILGCRQSQISNWLNEKTVPGFHSIKLICERLKVSADFLLGLE